MILRIKQFRQGRIILLLLDSIVLGSIFFSVTACQEVNLINQVLISRHEQEGKQNISAMVRYQLAYRLEHGRFSNSIEELGLATDTENYSYRIHRGIQTGLNDYQFLALDKATIKYLKISEDESFTSPKKPTRISSDILMISAQPKKVKIKSFVGFIFSCYDQSTGGTDCLHEPAIFPILYESEQPSTPPPNRMTVSLPLAYCGFKRGCLREKVPTPEGFRPVEDSNPE